MATERTIDPTSACEIAALLREADRGVVVLRSGGSTYQLRRIGRPQGSNDSDLEAWYHLLEGPPLLTDEEAADMIANIHRWRDEGSRPLHRPHPWPDTDG